MPVSISILTGSSQVLYTLAPPLMGSQAQDILRFVIHE